MRNASVQRAASGFSQKARHHPAQKRPGLRWPAAQRLGAVLQLAGQVQILNQAAHFFALGADAARFLSGCCGQGGLPLQLFRPAQDQCQRGADIMADPGDPLGSGGIPPGNDLIAAAQLLAGFVQLLASSPAKPAAGRLTVPPCAKVSSPAVTVCRLLLPRQLKTGSTPAPPAGAPPWWAECLCPALLSFFASCRCYTSSRFHRFRHNKQPVIRRPALHGVIGQVPVGEHGNFRCCVPVIQLLRQVLLPDDIAIIVQHHGPGIALHPFRRGMFPSSICRPFRFVLGHQPAPTRSPVASTRVGLNPT